MGPNLVEGLRKPSIGIAQAACHVDQNLGLSEHSLPVSDDGLQPLRHVLGLCMCLDCVIGQY